MPKDSKTAEFQEMLNHLAVLMNEASPVAMPIIAGAMLEDQVSRTIDRMMPDFDRMPGTDRVEHSLRISILHGLGVVSKRIADALRAFASIRNKFAHEPHKHTFDSQNVGSFANNLEKALRGEAEEEWKLFGEQLHTMLGQKYAEAGARANWQHPVAQTLISAFMMLTFYIIWARHHAPPARKPRQFSELSQT